MLEAISSSCLKSPVIHSEWSPKIDVIALTYAVSPDLIELRRMDWTKVNSIKLNSPINTFCFNSNGRNICVATSDNILSLFNIENRELLSSISFNSEITAIAFGEYNGINISAVALDNSEISLFSDFHFALCSISLPLPAIKLSLDGMNLYAVLEDYTTVSHYSLPFLNDYSVIHSISSSLSEYWNHHQIINNSKALIHESWKRIWDESKQFSNFKDQIVKSFLTGTTPPTISTEVHRSRVHKSIIHEFDQIQSIIADQIIPSFLSMDKASNSLFETLEFLPALGITLDSIDSSTQIKKCVSILKSIRKLKNCFDALFCYLDSPQTVLTDLEKLSVPNAQFADFLINYFQMFDMLEFSTGEGPICKPVYNAIQERNIELTGVISSMRCGKCCCIAETILVYSLRENKITELIVEGRPLAAYAFDDESIGCFYNNDGKIMFKMIGEEEQEPNEVSLIGASVFVFSPRKIALVSSDELFCSVVDLESCAGEEEEIEEDE